jgi:hypothetical protein
LGETSTPFGVPAFEMMRSIRRKSTVDSLHRPVKRLVAASSRVAEVAFLLDRD